MRINHLPSPAVEGSYDDFLFELNGLKQEGSTRKLITFLVNRPNLLAEFLRRQQKRIDVMEKTLLELQRNGTHHDTNPTVNADMSEDQLWMFFLRYIESMDKRVREIAAETIVREQMIDNEKA